MVEGLANPLKAKMQAGGVVLGMPIRLSRTPDIVRIAQATGHDFIFVDGQHSVFNPETVIAICHAALATDVAALVRVSGADDPNASLFLDNGAAGIVYPDINSAEQARRAVEVCKFAPIGKRSVSGGYAQLGFRSMSLAENLQQLNEHCLVVCMIETVEGLNNVEQIAGVAGVDVVHLGSNDLLTNLGKPGQFDDPDIVAAQERVIKAARASGIFAGCGGNRDVARQAKAISRGAQFVTTQTDTGFLLAAASQWTSGLRAALAKS